MNKDNVCSTSLSLIITDALIAFVFQRLKVITVKQLFVNE